MKLVPFEDFVVLRQARLPEKVGSLVVPEQIRKTLPYGEVIEVGPKVARVAVGDKVYFGARDGAGLPYNDEMVIIIREESIFCRVEGEYADILTSFASPYIHQ